jgi:monovalent cation/hydrogen antiporter
MTSIIETSLILLLLATLMVAFQSRLKLPLELLMLLSSLLISVIPHLPRVAVVPELVFLLFLPPILFAAAYFTSWRDFKANVRPITLLATGLVLFTSVSVAALVKWLVPSFSWSVAIVLGAMVSPPDASAASALTRKLGLPRRLVTILEGESLVNDATALIIYRFAIAATLSGTFSLSASLMQFVWVAAGGVVVGFLIGRSGLWLLLKMEDVKAQTVLSLITAFGAYIVGESVGVSGVISTVTAGLSFGRWLPLLGSPQTRIEAKANWDLVLFIINGFIFTVIGLQLPVVMGNLGAYSWKQLALYATVINIGVIAVRFIWVFPATYVPRLIFPSICRKDPNPPWRVVVLLGWMGMRGIVSLAAVMALPATFPHRPLLVFLTYSVILVTLILPPILLPVLLRVLKITGGHEHDREEALSRYATTKAVLDHLGELNGKGHPVEQIDLVRARYERRLKTIEPNLGENAYSSVNLDDQRQRRLLQSVIAWERDALKTLRQTGKIHDELFHSLSYELDLEDLRLRTPRL